jgi:hypothetical protein
MTTFITAASCIELPREVDAYAAAIAILFELCTDIDTTVSRHFYVAGMEDVVDKKDMTEKRMPGVQVLN